MSLVTVRAALANLKSSGLLRGELTIIWHAGEPLAAGRPFYQSAFAVTQEFTGPNVHIRNAIQTNATLITPPYAELFRRYDVRVGVSIDGPAFLHDSFRTTRSGRGTHKMAMRGIQHLREAGLSFHVICVLTPQALSHADELFEFFRDLGASEVGFNVEEEEGINSGAGVTRGEYEAQYHAFMERIFRRLVTEGDVFRLRERHDMLRRVLRRDAVTSSQAAPFAIVTVAADGGFSMFSPELHGFNVEPHGRFEFGNVHETLIRDAMRESRAKSICDDIYEGVAACRARCGYFTVCGGGAPSNKYFENGSLASTETRYCRLVVQAVADITLRLLTEGERRVTRSPRDTSQPR